MKATSLLCATALVLVACGDTSDPAPKPAAEAPATLRVEYYEISEK